LPGLRHARNAIVHGEAVVDAVDAETVPTPRVTMASGAGTGSHSRVITPPSRIQWTFTRTLPPPGNPAPILEAAYAAIADKEVLVPIQSAINWLDRELARRFHGWLECARVDQLKSAPDQRGSRLSKPASSQIEEHLSGEAA
jgi:hypothetical protein